MCSCFSKLPILHLRKLVKTMSPEDDPNVTIAELYKKYFDVTENPQTLLELYHSIEIAETPSELAKDQQLIHLLTALITVWTQDYLKVVRELNEPQHPLEARFFNLFDS
jgi:hypothetical protein